MTKKINIMLIKKKGNKQMLVLPIKKKWFDMIISGEKKEEYREIKPYYDKRRNIKLKVEQ